LVRLEQLPHAPQVLHGETAQPRHLLRQVLRQALDHAFAPLRRGQLAADVRPDLPVETDELGIDRLVGPLPRLLDQPHHLGERRRLCHLLHAAQCARSRSPHDKEKARPPPMRWTRKKTAPSITGAAPCGPDKAC
jgi:hypothetical protein